MLLSCILIIAVVGYFVGNINGAIIASKYFYKKDIRQYGSGNPGLTNFYRVFGKGGVLLVVLIDILKTVIPVLLGGFLLSHIAGRWLLGCQIAGLFAMLGHAFPVIYGFKGGKTVLSAGAMLFFIDWRVAALSWGAFILLSALTRYVSLGSIVAAIAYPVGMLIFGVGGTVELVLAAVSALVIIARHNKNIERLIQGRESKFKFRRKKENDI
jgi:glycerol-3-phosphate acyltransferase PlsY